MNTQRIRLFIIFGGQSAEHDVSCVSARHVLAAVDRERFDVTAIGITRTGDWVLAQDAVDALDADALPDTLTAAGPAVDLVPLLRSGAAEQTVVFPVLHGPNGEDGSMQGLLEIAGVPYVGAGILASALCMDKVACKDHLASANIPQCAYRWVSVDHGEARHADGRVEPLNAAVEAFVAELGFPMFIKPANMGSSVGVSRATNLDEAIEAAELAATYDRDVIFEEAMIGREIEVAVLGNEDPQASVAGEIAPGADFYDYADKYDDGADLIIPAPLDPDELAEMQRLAIAAYRACEVEGLARVDFFYEDGSGGDAHARGWMINEINTMPGFTPISMYSKMWAASGVDYSELVDRLVRFGLDRFARQQRHTRTDH